MSATKPAAPKAIEPQLRYVDAVGLGTDATILTDEQRIKGNIQEVKCPTDNYGSIPATLDAFKKFVGEKLLLPALTAFYGEKNPCKDVAPDKYDDLSTGIGCRALVQLQRQTAIPYASTSVVDKAAQQMNPLYLAISNVVHSERIAVAAAIFEAREKAGLALLNTGGEPSFLASLMSFIQKDPVAARAERFVTALENGTNIECLTSDMSKTAEKNICDQIIEGAAAVMAKKYPGFTAYAPAAAIADATNSASNKSEQRACGITFWDGLVGQLNVWYAATQQIVQPSPAPIAAPAAGTAKVSDKVAAARKALAEAEAADTKAQKK